MGRIILVLILLGISGIIYLAKAGASKVAGREIGDFHDESRRVMEKTAKGINWMNEQWEKAKTNNSSTAQLASGSLIDKSATEIIASVKANPEKYQPETAKSVFIESAVTKMNNRQFDDARKLVLQLKAGEARDYMLQEIEDKRNA